MVTFDDVRRAGERASSARSAGPPTQVERQLQRAVVLANAESVGAMQAGFDMTVEWAFDRYSFGRPLASYQALKHRFADMKSWLEASHAIGDEAAARRRRRAPRGGRAGQRGQGVHRRVRHPSWSRTASSCTAASASPSSTTSTSSCAGTP